MCSTYIFLLSLVSLSYQFSFPINPMAPIRRSLIIQASNANIDSNNLMRKVFCNVELNGATIEAVGFDMDYTLAQVIFLTSILDLLR